jgi:hypothetical protein
MPREFREGHLLVQVAEEEHKTTIAIVDAANVSIVALTMDSDDARRIAHWILEMVV